MVRAEHAGKLVIPNYGTGGRAVNEKPEYRLRLHALKVDSHGVGTAAFTMRRDDGSEWAGSADVRVIEGGVAITGFHAGLIELGPRLGPGL